MPYMFHSIAGCLVCDELMLALVAQAFQPQVAAVHLNNHGSRQLWAWRLLTSGVALRLRVKGNGKMDSENIRAYVMKIIMERLQPTAEKAQKDGTTAQELADYRLRHGALWITLKHSCGRRVLCTHH